MSDFGISKVVDYTYDEAVEKVVAGLKKEGFGVLTDIDIKATLKEKIGKEFNNYRILGACNPNFAYEGLLSEEELGILLPCNVIIYDRDGGETVVSAVDPRKVLGVADNDEMLKLATQVGDHMHRVIDSL